MTYAPSHPLSLTTRFFQFYSWHVLVLTLSIAGFGGLWWFDRGELLSIPRDGFLQTVTICATLLGLTLAAFSIMTTLLPVMKPKLLELRLFLMMAQTFVFAMVAQTVTLVLAGLCYVLYGQPYVSQMGAALVLPGLLSVGLLLLSIDYVFSVFRIVRAELAPPGAPKRVLSP